MESIILLSGGLDSAANLAFCHQNGLPVLALTVDYGQKAVKNEIKAARALSAYYKVAHEVLNLDWLGKLGGNSLTDEAHEIPGIKTSQLDDREITTDSARSVWVPNRNGILIHAAAAYAERFAIQQVLVGFNSEEAVTFPDNSIDYLNRVNQALALSTSNQVEVHSYTAEYDKTQIVAELLKLSVPFPFQLIWSCYEGGESACEMCESCRRLNRALKKSA